MFEFIIDNILSTVCKVNRYYHTHIKDEVKFVNSIIYDFITSDINHSNYILD